MSLNVKVMGGLGGGSSVKVPPGPRGPSSVSFSDDVSSKCSL